MLAFAIIDWAARLRRFRIAGLALREQPDQYVRICFCLVLLIELRVQRFNRCCLKTAGSFGPAARHC